MGKLVTPKVYWIGCTGFLPGERGLRAYLEESGNADFLATVAAARNDEVFLSRMIRNQGQQTSSGHDLRRKGWWCNAAGEKRYTVSCQDL